MSNYKLVTKSRELGDFFAVSYSYKESVFDTLTRIVPGLNPSSLNSLIETAISRLIMLNKNNMGQLLYSVLFMASSYYQHNALVLSRDQDDLFPELRIGPALLLQNYGIDNLANFEVADMLYAFAWILNLDCIFLECEERTFLFPETGPTVKKYSIMGSYRDFPKLDNAKGTLIFIRENDQFRPLLRKYNGLSMLFPRNIDIDKYFTIVNQITKRPDLGLKMYPQSLDIFRANIQYAQNLDSKTYNVNAYKIYYALLASKGFEPFVVLSEDYVFLRLLERKSRKMSSSKSSLSMESKEEEEESSSESEEEEEREAYLSTEPEIIEAPSSSSPRYSPRPTSYPRSSLSERRSR